MDDDVLRELVLTVERTGSSAESRERANEVLSVEKAPPCSADARLFARYIDWSAMQKIVVLDENQRSPVIEGDEDEARFEKDAPLAGTALPTLLAEGWRVATISGNGRVFVLERGTILPPEPPPHRG